MSEKKDKSATKKRSVAAGLGLGAASLLAAQNAGAAQQVADLAAGDNRVGILAALAVPAVSLPLHGHPNQRNSPAALADSVTSPALSN